MEEWNEQTKHAQESCRQAGTRPQVSHFSMPVPQLLPFLLILLLQWSVFPTQIFIVHFCVVATSDSSPPRVSCLHLRMVRSGLEMCLGHWKAQHSCWGLLVPIARSTLPLLASLQLRQRTQAQKQVLTDRGNRWKRTNLESHRRTSEVTQT